MDMKVGLVALAAVAALTAGCGGSGSEAGDKDAVRKAAQEQADRFSSGDYGGAYDMWVDSAKKLMTRDDYVKYAKTCHLGGVPLTAKFIRFEGDKTAIVRVGLGNVVGSYMMKLEHGDWSWVPNQAAQAEYKLGLAGAIAASKKDGSCT